MWSRLTALKDAGVEVQLVVWTDTGEIAGHEASLREGVSQLVVMRRALKRALLWRGTYPPRMLTFQASGAVAEKLLFDVRRFAPQAVLLDAWPAYLTAKRLADRVGVPLLYRSHNIEHI